MQNPLRFSVVINSYNRRDYVCEAVESVLQQTYAAHEIIVIVDGSSDDSVDVLQKRYPHESFPQVQIVDQVNSGVAMTRNTGIALATGNWMAFLDDDDLWHREKLQITADHIAQRPECGAINNAYWVFATSAEESGEEAFEADFIARDLQECHKAVENGDPSRKDFSFMQIEGKSFRLLLEAMRGSLSSSVVRRDILIRAGGFAPMQGCTDDWTMAINVARICEWHTIPRRLVFIRTHGQQATHNIYNSVNLLSVLVHAWHSGRPFPAATDRKTTRRRLASYGHVYRRYVQIGFWGAVRLREYWAARLIFLLGLSLLPRSRDILYILTPPQVTWRVENKRLLKEKK